MMYSSMCKLSRQISIVNLGNIKGPEDIFVTDGIEIAIEYVNNKPITL